MLGHNTNILLDLSRKLELKAEDDSIETIRLNKSIQLFLKPHPVTEKSNYSIQLL